MVKRKNGCWREYHNVYCNTEDKGDGADGEAGDEDDKAVKKNRDGEGGYTDEGSHQGNRDYNDNNGDSGREVLKVKMLMRLIIRKKAMANIQCIYVPIACILLK